MGKSGPLGDRMKRYEAVQTSNCLIRRVPVIVRVDGRAFHTLTASMKKPFDSDFISHMCYSARRVADAMQGFKFGYVQSDEASFLLTDFDSIMTEPWFGYDLCKVVSISSALMSALFNQSLNLNGRDFGYDHTPPVFDARAFNIPVDEVANYFLWRMKDWERNSLQMYARSIYSHGELHEKNHEKLHELIRFAGKNWATDLSEQERNGTCIYKNPGSRELFVRSDILPHYKDVSEVISPLLAYRSEGDANEKA